MVRNLLLVSLIALLGCASADKITPVVIPEDGSTTDYSEFLPRMRVLAWRATEAFYRDRWDELEEAAQNLEKAVRVLKQSKNVPVRVQTVLSTRCDTLIAECGHLKSAAHDKAAEPASDYLQKIHVLIRELRSES